MSSPCTSAHHAKDISEDICHESVCQAEGSVLSATHSASTLPEVEAPPEDEVAGSVLFVSTPSDSDGLADSLS